MKRIPKIIRDHQKMKNKAMKTKKHKVEIPEDYEFVTNEVCAKGDELRVSKVYHKKPIKKQLPKTWEEYERINNIDISREWAYVLVPNKYLSAFVALSKLLELRDVYNDGWVTYKSHDYEKYIIFISNDDICTGCAQSSVSRILSFKIEKLRDEFLYNFRDLIEQAKPLL